MRVSAPHCFDDDIVTRIRSSTEPGTHVRSGLLAFASCGSMLAPRSCRVLIEVEDNGPGVPPEIAVRLFSPFTQVRDVARPGHFACATALLQSLCFLQADSSTTRRFGGTGLGLSIVRGLAELMGGSARVVSPNSMGGATFACSLQLLTAPPPGETLRAASAIDANADVSVAAIATARGGGVIIAQPPLPPFLASNRIREQP